MTPKKKNLPEILSVINQWFTPPLDEKELQGIIQSALGQAKEEKEGERKSVLSSVIKMSMTEKYKDVLFFEPETANWYRWNGVFWEEVQKHIMQRLVMDEIESLDKTAQKMTLITDALGLLSIELARSSKESPLGLINFANGVFNISSLTLEPHSPEYNFTYVIDTEYDMKAFPDERLKFFLLNLVCGNKHALHLLRGGIRRAIDPAFTLQTAFWIWGPPGTGKSTLLPCNLSNEKTFFNFKAFQTSVLDAIFFSVWFGDQGRPPKSASFSFSGNVFSFSIFSPNGSLATKKDQSIR